MSNWDDETSFNWGQMAEEATVVLEGDFPVTVVKTEATKSQNGKHMIKVKFKIDSGQYMGRALFTNFVISPESSGAMRMFFSQLAVFGLDSQFFASIAGQPPTAIAQALDGRKAIAIVKKGQWNGADREEISGYKPALGGHGGGTFVPGLGGAIGGASSSPFGSSPSPTTYTSSTPSLSSAASASVLAAETSTESPVQADGAALEASEPSAPPPLAPSF